MQGKWKNGKPKYLNWKCIDNFDKVSDDKIYYDCKDIKLSEKQRRDAKREFDILRVKYTKIIKDFLEECNGEKKTHLTVAGGNYTFFFTLPHVVKWVRERHPFLGVHIQLFERGGVAKLTDQDADIILTSETDHHEKIDHKELSNGNYASHRFFAQDHMFLAASKNALEFFGSKENVLKYHDVLFGRVYSALYPNFEAKVDLYATVNRGNMKFQPRVVIDQYFLEYLLLTQSVGIGYIFTTMHLSNLVTLYNSIENYKRFIIHKKNLNKQYKSLGRFLVRCLKEKRDRV